MKIIAILMALIFLCGCAVVPSEETTESSAAELTTEVSPLDSTGATEAKLTEPRVIPAEMAQHREEILITQTNWDVDIYTDSARTYTEFYIISSKPIQRDDIRVDIDITRPYTVESHKYNSQEDAPIKLSKDPYANVLFSYETYLTYCGVNWADLAQKYQTHQTVLADYRADKNQDKKAAVQEALASYEDIYNAYQEDYYLLTPAMLPQFYCYQVIILYDYEEDGIEEVFNSITLVVGEQTLSQDIGEVRLHNTEGGPDDPLASDYGYTPLSQYTLIPYLSNKYQMNTQFNAKKDVLITGIQLGGITPLQFHVDTGSTDFQWDGKTPFQLKAGQTASVYIDIEDPRFSMDGFEFRTFVVFSFTADDLEMVDSYEHTFYHSPDSYQVYAEYFDGLDMSAYYEDFYFPCIKPITTRH